MKYNEIIGQECAKRAIEIALTGNHSIKFIGNEEADQLKEACDELKIKTMAIKPCACGYYNNLTKDCICTPAQLKRYFKTKKWREFCDITIEAKEVNAKKIIDAINGKNDGELFEKMIKRVKIAKNIKVKDGIEDKQTKELLESTIRQNYLTSQKAIFGIVAVAKTITKLDSKDEITACAIAEALQYRQRQ